MRALAIPAVLFALAFMFDAGYRFGKHDGWTAGFRAGVEAFKCERGASGSPVVYQPDPNESVWIVKNCYECEK